MCFVQLHNDVVLEKCDDSTKETCSERKGEIRRGGERRKERLRTDEKDNTGKEMIGIEIWRSEGMKQGREEEEEQGRTGKERRGEERKGGQREEKERKEGVRYTQCPLKINTQPTSCPLNPLLSLFESDSHPEPRGLWVERARASLAYI